MRWILKMKEVFGDVSERCVESMSMGLIDTRTGLHAITVGVTDKKRAKRFRTKKLALKYMACFGIPPCYPVKT